jgi:hypothetical protein
MDELTAYYTNKVLAAGFKLVGVRDLDLNRSDRVLPYHPSRLVSYLNSTGQTCCAYIFDNTPNREPGRYRTVRLECHFTGLFLNPESYCL